MRIQHALTLPEPAPYYSITSSAPARIDGGIVMPSALAALRLIASSREPPVNSRLI